MADFVLFKEDIDRLNKILSHTLTESAASFVLLINKDGNLISQVGFNPHFDVTSLAALAAGSFASTKAIASLVGENEFSVMFHQGQNQNIHISLIDEDVIMVLIFDDRTNLGLVKTIAVQARGTLQEALLDVRNNQFYLAEPPTTNNPSQDLNQNIDGLFPGQQ